MTDAPEDSVSERPLRAAPDSARLGPVTYTLKVLSTEGGDGGAGRRTVLFQRTAAGNSIEISAETDAPNLLTQLPDLLEAALSVERALGAPDRLVAGSPRRTLPSPAEEFRLLRRLTEGEAAPVTPKALRVIDGVLRPRGKLTSPST